MAHPSNPENLPEAVIVHLSLTPDEALFLYNSMMLAAAFVNATIRGRPGFAKALDSAAQTVDRDVDRLGPSATNALGDRLQKLAQAANPDAREGVEIIDDDEGGIAIIII
jgi:hypothetical protein